MGEPTPDVRLATPRLLLRAFVPQDADDLQEILGDAEVMRFSEPPYSPGQTRRFLAEFCIGQKGGLAAVHRASGKTVGYLLFRAQEPGVYELGWFFNRAYWRQGYAFEACSALMEYAFCTLRAHKLFAETTDGAASVRLMEKLGMRAEGLQRGQLRDSAGHWADLYLYGILASEWPRAAAARERI